MGSLWGPLDWLFGDDEQQAGDIAVITGTHPDPNATTAERDQFAAMRAYERREYLNTSYTSPQSNVATGGPAVRGLGGALGSSLMYGLDSDDNLLPPTLPVPPTPVEPSRAAPVAVGGIQPAHAVILTPENVAHAQSLMDQMPGGENDIFGNARAGFYSSGALTAAGKVLEKEQVWTAPWNIGQYTNPFAVAEAAVDESKPWQQQVAAVGAFGQALWGDIEHLPLIGHGVQVSERTGATVLYGGLGAVQDLITAPIGGKYDRRTGITTGGLSVLEAMRGITQVVVEPWARGMPEPMEKDPALNQPLSHDLGYMYAWEYEQRSQRAYQQYLHDKRTRADSLSTDVAAAVADGAVFGVGARSATDINTPAEWLANLTTLPQVYAGMQAARNPESYRIPISSLTPKEAEDWRLLQRAAWGVRDTQGSGWLNVGESYTANVRFIGKKDDALAQLDQDIKLMGVLSHATVDLGRTADDEVRKVLTDNGLDFMLRGMPFELPGQPSPFGTWGVMRPPKDDTWMYNEDPVYGVGWRRSEEDYIEALTLLGRAGEIRMTDSAGGARYTDPVHQWLYDRGLIGTTQYSDEQLAAAYAQDRATKLKQSGVQLGLMGPAQDPHRFGVNPMVFGMTQNDVSQSFEDIRERAGAIQNVLRTQRNELRDMDVLDWQGKMLDWRPMLLWGMLLDPFDWYARGIEGMGLSSKALRAGFEHFGIVEMQGGDAVRNISRGVQGLPPVRSPGDSSGIVTMHGGLGWNLFTNPEALYPEMRQSADDILEMIASGADLDNSEAIGARARIAQTMIKAGLVDPALAAGGDLAIWGADDAKTIAQLVAEGHPEFGAATGLRSVEDIEDLTDLSGRVYKGLQVPKAQQLQLPRGFGMLSSLPGADVQTLSTLQDDIAFRYLANLYREPTQKEVIAALASQKGVVPWQREMYGYLGEAGQALSKEDAAYKVMIPLDMGMMPEGEMQKRSSDIYRMVLGISEMTGSTGITADVFNLAYDPATKNLILPLQLQTADVLDDGAWMLGNMHRNPQAVVRGRMTTDLAMYKFRLYGSEADAGAALAAGAADLGQFPTFDEFLQVRLEGRRFSDVTAEEMAKIEREYDIGQTEFDKMRFGTDDGSLPKMTQVDHSKDRGWNSDYFNSLVLQNARGLVGGYDTSSAQFFAKMALNEPAKFERVQNFLKGYGVYVEPTADVAGSKVIMASVQNLQGESVQQGLKLHYYNEKGLAVPGVVDPYASAFDYKSYWGDWWQASGFKRADSPNFNVVQDRYPLVPEQLQKVYDDTQTGLRREKAEAAASQVTYYNAEKWLYEKLAGAETAPPDLKTMMVADLLLEQQGLPYYIDWEKATRGPQGYNLAQIPLVQGRPAGLQSSTWRSGYLRMDEKYQQALATARGPSSGLMTPQNAQYNPFTGAWEPSTGGTVRWQADRSGLPPGRESPWGATQMGPNPEYYDAAAASGYLRTGKMGTTVANSSQLDALRARVLPELMETWEAGGRGSITVSQYEMLASYRDLSRAAADSGLVVRPDLPVKLDNGMYQINYQLRPIAENDPDWVRTGGDPYRAIQAVSENFVNMGLKGLRRDKEGKWVKAAPSLLPGMGELVTQAKVWAAGIDANLNAMTVGTAGERAAGAVTHYGAQMAGVTPYSPQFTLDVPTYQFGPAYSKIDAVPPGSLAVQTDILTLLKEGNDPRFVYGRFVPGTSGVTDAAAPGLLVKNQQWGGSQGFDFLSRIEDYIVKQLGLVFGTPAGASATTPVLTRDIPHGGTMEVAGDPGYVKWPGDMEAGKPAFRRGTGIHSDRGRKAGELAEAHEANLMGPREPITKGDVLREAENSDKFDVYGSDEEVSVSPDAVEYAMAAENLETLRLQNTPDWALSDYVYDPKSKSYVMRPDDEERRMASLEVAPPPPLVPYTSLPRGMAEYDGPNGLRQFYIDRITGFRYYMAKSAEELGLTLEQDEARRALAAKVTAAINQNPLVKIARGTLEQYADANKMMMSVLGGASGTNNLSGEWVWNEVEKKAEWVARQFNIGGTGLHVAPNRGGQGARSVWSLLLPSGSFTYATEPVYLPGGGAVVPALPEAKEARTAYEVAHDLKAGQGEKEEFWWWGAFGWKDPKSGQEFIFNEKGLGPKHWKVIQRQPTQTIIGPLAEPQYYFTSGKPWVPMPANATDDLDLEAIGARVPDEEFKPFLSFMESEELKLSTYEQVWPWLYSPASEFISKVPDVQMGPQLGLFSPSTPLLRHELEVEKLAQQEAMGRGIRTSLQMFNDNLPYIENYIRKTLGITDPEGVAAKVQEMYNEAVARFQANQQGAASFGAAIADYDEEMAAATEFIDKIKPLTSPEEIAANTQRVWNQTMANFGAWVDSAPKGWTDAELAAQDAAELERAQAAEEAATWAEWNQQQQAEAAAVQASRYPGQGKWQVINQWNEATTGVDADGRPITIYPQTRIAPASYQPLQKIGRGEELSEADIAERMNRHNWLSSGPAGEFTPVPEVQQGPKSAAKRKDFWQRFGNKGGNALGEGPDGTVSMGGGLGMPAQGGMPDFTGGLSKEERASIRGINEAISKGSRSFADLSQEEWELMFRGWDSGLYSYPKTMKDWPTWAIERRDRVRDYDSWVRSQARKLGAGQPGVASAAGVDLGKTARISASEFSGPQSPAGKGGIFLSDRSQVLDVQQQADGKYLVVVHDGTQVRAYVMDDVRPELLKTDKVTSLGKRTALGIGVESPTERAAWLGEHGIMDTAGASFSNAQVGSLRGQQQGSLPRVARADQVPAPGAAVLGEEVEDEEFAPIQRLDGTSGEQEAPPVDTSLTAGQRLRLQGLHYSDDQILAMTPERRAEVLREGIDAVDADPVWGPDQKTYGAGWLGGMDQPTAQDVAAEQSATGAGPVTTGYRVPYEPDTDRVGWTMRLNNEQGMSEVGLVVDQADAGSGAMYRVRTRNGREYWVSGANAQFVTPATNASRAAAAAPAPVPPPVPPAPEGPFTPGEMPGAPPYLRQDVQTTALQLGPFDRLTDTLSPAFADASGKLQARNVYQQAGAETYRLGQGWRGPLAGEEGAAPQFRKGDIVLVDGENGPSRVQVVGVGQYNDPVLGPRDGYKLHDGSIVPPESVRGLAWQNPRGAEITAALSSMNLIEQAQARKVYQSGGYIVPYTPPVTAIVPYAGAVPQLSASGLAEETWRPRWGGAMLSREDEAQLRGIYGEIAADWAPAPYAVTQPVTAADEAAELAATGAGPVEQAEIPAGVTAPVQSAGPGPVPAAGGGAGQPPRRPPYDEELYGEEPDDWTAPEGAQPGQTGPDVVGPDGTVNGGIPFVMTNRMRADLSYAGYTQDEINAMTPVDAWNILNGGPGSGGASAAPAAAAAAPAGAAAPVALPGAAIAPQMRSQLLMLGFSDDAIDQMTPAYAQATLNAYASGGNGGAYGAGAGGGGGAAGGAGAGGAAAGGAGGGAVGGGGGGVGGPGAGLPGAAGGLPGGPGVPGVPPAAGAGAAAAAGAGQPPWYQRGFAGALNSFFGPGGAFPNAVGNAAGGAAAAAGNRGQQFYNSLLSGAHWLDNHMLWSDTAGTKAAKFRDQWTMVASMLTSSTTDPMELSFLLDAWAADPEGFMASGVNLNGAFAQQWKAGQLKVQRSLGVPRSLDFSNLEAQADEFGYFSLDPRVFGNQETADTLPIIQWMSPAFGAAAQVVRDIPAAKWQGGDTFMKVFSTFLDDGGKAYYNVTDPGPVGKVVKGIGDLQRHVQAEMVLNLNPGNWIGNWVGAWATGAYEGYGSLKKTGEYIEQMYNIFNAAPTERIRDSLEGRPTGSRAHLTWSDSKLFRPAAWLQGIEPAVEYFASAQSKHAVRDWFQRAEKAADTWNPLTPFAWLSDTTNRVWTTMTHLPFTGKRVGFGEAANYMRTYGAAQEDALGRNMAHAFDQTLMTMMADDVLSQSPEGQAAVSSIMGMVPTTAEDMMSRSAFAQELQKIIGGVQDPDVKARLQTYAGDMLLHDFDANVFASLRTGVKGANNVMLNPEYRKVIDEAMGPFMAFSYFTTRTAGNWAARVLTDPRALGWWGKWERSAGQYGEQNEVPIRYKEMLPGPGGFMLSNPINFLLGINKMMPGSPPNPDRADNLGDMAQQYAGLFNLRFMPGWMALLSGDPRNLWGGFMPQGQMVGQMGVLAEALGGMAVNAMYEDDYAPSRKGRAIAATQVTTGQQDFDVQAEATLALQALFETMWGIEPKTEMTPGSAAALQYGEKKVAFEGLVPALSRFLTGYTAKAPIDPDEQSAMALSAILKAVMPQEGTVGGDWDTWKYIAGLYPGLSVWHAQGDLYPTESGLPGSEPAERLDDIRPTPPMISKPAYPGFEWPVWDTRTGRLMESAQDSPFADPGDNTALYMLVDPRTGRVHYVGQSVQPSERINQHIEEFDEKGWSHPKTAWIGEMLRQGVYPQMYVFDWEPGSTKLNFDKADQVEQLWIGFLYYELGNRVWTDSVNVSIPTRETWEEIVADSGMTKEQLREQFTKFQENPATWDRVRMAAAPKLERSPFSGLFPFLPRPGLPQVDQQKIAPDYGVHFDVFLPGEVGPKTTQILHDAGIMTWDQLADPANQEKIAGLKGVSERDAAEWMSYANMTLAVQRGDMMVPMDGRENEVEGQPQEFLVYPLTAAAQQAGEAGATAAIQAAGFGTPRGNFNMVFMPSIAKGVQMQATAAAVLAAGQAAAPAHSPLPAQGAGTGMPAGAGGVSLGSLRPAPAPVTLGSLRPAPGTPPLTLGRLRPAATGAGTPAPNPWGPGQTTHFGSLGVLGGAGQKAATVVDTGRHPTFDIRSPFDEVEQQLPGTSLPSNRPTFDLERDASIAEHRAKIDAVHANFAKGRESHPEMTAMGAASLLSWIFTPSQEQSTAPSMPGVYNYTERTRMEADQGKRQQRAYYEQANDRTNLSLITGASALAIGLGQALTGGLVGQDTARLFFKGAGLGGVAWAGLNGYLGWDLGQRGKGGPTGPVVPPEGGPPKLGPAKSNKFVYIPGWRPNVKPGIKFELPTLPDGTQIWVPQNMLSIEGTPGYQNADWLNNPQFDPAHPEESLARIEAVYGKAQPVPLPWLAREGAFMGPGPHLDYDQPRTILTGRKTLEANPYGVGGAAGMWQTQGAPDPRTQPELYAKWSEEVVKPRGEYGIWLRSPLGGDPLLVEGYGDNKDYWKGQGYEGHTGLDYAVKPMTSVAAAAPGQVVAIGENAEFGKFVVVQHDWGTTIYGNMDGIGVAEGDWLAAGDTIGMAGGLDVKGNKGDVFHFGMQVAGVEGPEGMGGWVDPTAYLPSTGDAGKSGWRWTDVPGISTRLAQMLNDAGITNPDQIGDMDPAQAAALIDQFNGELGESLDAEGGWAVVRNVKALLSMGNKPQELIDAENKAKKKALDAAGGYWGGLEGPGADPNAPYTGTGDTSDSDVSGGGSGGGSASSGGGSGGSSKKYDNDVDDDGINDLWDDDVKEPDLPPEKVMGKILAAPGEGVKGTSVPWSKERNGMPVRNINPDLYPGLTPDLVDALHEANIYSVEQLLEIAEWDNGVQAIAGIKGIGTETAKTILRGAIKWDERRRQIAKGQKPNEKLQEGMFEGLGEQGIAAAAGLKIYDVSGLATANPADLANFSKEDNVGDKTARDLVNQARAWQGLEPLPEDGEAEVTLDTTIAPGQVKGLGPAMIGTLNAAGIYTYRDAMTQGKDALDAVKGVGPALLDAFWGKVVEANGGTDPTPADGKQNLEDLKSVGPKTEKAFYEAGLINEQAILELETPEEIAAKAKELGDLPENHIDMSPAGLTEIINEVRAKAGLPPLKVPPRDAKGEATVESIAGTPDDLAILAGMDPKIAAANDIDQFSDLNRWSDDALMTTFGVDKKTVEWWRKTVRAQQEAKAAAGAGFIVGGEPADATATPAALGTPVASPTVAPSGDILNGAQQRATGTPAATPVAPAGTPTATPNFVTPGPPPGAPVYVPPGATPTVTPTVTPTPDSVGSVVDPAALASSFNLGGQLSGFTAVSTRGNVRDVPLGQTVPAGRPVAPGAAAPGSVAGAAGAAVAPVAIDEDDLAHRVLALFYRDWERNMRGSTV